MPLEQEEYCSCAGSFARGELPSPPRSFLTMTSVRNQRCRAALSWRSVGLGRFAKWLTRQAGEQSSQGRPGPISRGVRSGESGGALRCADAPLRGAFGPQRTCTCRYLVPQTDTNSPTCREQPNHFTSHMPDAVLVPHSPWRFHMMYAPELVWPRKLRTFLLEKLADASHRLVDSPR